jgi:hypothetical protein
MLMILNALVAVFVGWATFDEWKGTRKREILMIFAFSVVVLALNAWGYFFAPVWRIADATVGILFVLVGWHHWRAYYSRFYLGLSFWGIASLALDVWRYIKPMFIHMTLDNVWIYFYAETGVTLVCMLFAVWIAYANSKSRTPYMTNIIRVSIRRFGTAIERLKLKQINAGSINVTEIVRVIGGIYSGQCLWRGQRYYFHCTEHANDPEIPPAWPRKFLVINLTDKQKEKYVGRTDMIVNDLHAGKISQEEVWERMRWLPLINIKKRQFVGWFEIATPQEMIDKVLGLQRS